MNAVRTTHIAQLTDLRPQPIPPDRRRHEPPRSHFPIQLRRGFIQIQRRDDGRPMPPNDSAA